MLTHYYGLWPADTVVSNGDVIAGTGSVHHNTTASMNTDVINHDFTGVANGTYDLHWYAEDWIEGVRGPVNRVTVGDAASWAFVTAPVAVNITHNDADLQFSFTSPGDVNGDVYAGCYLQGSNPSDSDVINGIGAIAGTYQALGSLAPDTLHTVAVADPYDPDTAYEWYVVVVGP